MSQDAGTLLTFHYILAKTRATAQHVDVLNYFHEGPHQNKGKDVTKACDSKHSVVGLEAASARVTHLRSSNSFDYRVMNVMTSSVA